MNLDGRHSSVKHFAPLFAYSHLPEQHLRGISKAVHDLAEAMVQVMPDSPELAAGLRKLLEAKDCFVRGADFVVDTKSKKGALESRK
jgi:hypothetical protein